MDVVHHRGAATERLALELLAERAVLVLELTSSNKLRAFRTLTIHRRSVVIPEKKDIARLNQNQAFNIEELFISVFQTKKKTTTVTNSIQFDE